MMYAQQARRPPHPASGAHKLIAPSAARQDGINTQLVESTRANSPRYSMRPKLGSYAASSPRAKTPGPGRRACPLRSRTRVRGDDPPCVRATARSYNEAAAFGPQVRSAPQSAAAYSFGFSERARPELNYKKTPYMGKDFDRANFGARPAPRPAQIGRHGGTRAPRADGKACATGRPRPGRCAFARAEHVQVEEHHGRRQLQWSDPVQQPARLHLRHRG
jgi:hypothetical protein